MTPDLEGVAGLPKNLVNVSSFVTDLKEARTVAQVRGKFSSGGFAASTQARVAALRTTDLEPNLKIESEAIAVLPD